MFGYAAFAQPTFAGLGGSFFAVNILEALTAGDLATAIRIHNADTTEAITSADFEASIIVTFVTAILEGFTANDLPTGSSAFFETISENLTLADIEAAIKIHNATAIEPISLADVTQCFGFGTIDNSQTAVWTLIDNRQ
jgi:hypothetical protein